MHHPIVATAFVTGGFTCIYYLDKLLFKQKLKDARVKHPTQRRNYEKARPALGRETELRELQNRVPTKLSNDWILVSSPHGLGKSWLTAAFASDWQGPTLFTDLRCVEPTKAAVEAALAETIHPYLTINLRAMFFVARIAGATQWSNRKKLSLFREAALQIAAESEGAVPVLWVVDGFDVLVHGSMNHASAAQRCAVATLFQINDAAIVLPVTSSATTVRNLTNVCGHVAARSRAHYPVFHADRKELLILLKYSLQSAVGNAATLPTDEVLMEAVSFVGDSLLTYNALIGVYRAAIAGGGDPDEVFRTVLEAHKNRHANTVRTVLGTHKRPSTCTTAELEASIERYQILQCLASVSVDIMPQEQCRHLLTAHADSGPIVGMRESKGRHYLWYVEPGTADVVNSKEILKEMELVVKELVHRYSRSTSSVL